MGPFAELTMTVAHGEDPPRSLAILPFRDRTGTPGLADLVRRGVYGRVSVLPYRDVELNVVDRRLRSRSKGIPCEPSEICAKQLGPVIGSDALIFGTVTEFQRIFVGVYSQLAVGASIEIWDARTGRKIWSDQEVVRFHEGGVPLSPLDMGMAAVRSGLNLRHVVKMRAVDEMTRYLAQRIPVPRLAPGGDGATAGRRYELQVGAFRQERRALELLDTLRSKSHRAFVRTGHDQGGIWHRVLVGPYDDWEECIRVQEEVYRELGADSFVSESPPEADPRD